MGSHLKFVMLSSQEIPKFTWKPTKLFTKWIQISLDDSILFLFLKWSYKILAGKGMGISGTSFAFFIS